jgi:excisionase family DNA binding protein
LQAAGARVEERAIGMTVRSLQTEPLLTPKETASMFGVDRQTVTRWAKAGKLSSVMTLGGHRRFREEEVRQLLHGIPGQRGSGR